MAILFLGGAINLGGHAAAFAEGDGCLRAVSAAERTFHLPPALLVAISIVESGRSVEHAVAPAAWPWTINADGVAHFYARKADAIDAVQTMRAAGARSIDVGCMQISLLYHPDAFASIEQAFEPADNAAYGARFLWALFGQFHDWPKAVAAYHSQTNEIGQPYAKRVMALWPAAAAFPPDISDDDTAAGSTFTPAFAAVLRQLRRDRARDLPALPLMSPLPATILRRDGDLAARIRKTSDDVARLRQQYAAPAAASGRSRPGRDGSPATRRAENS